MMNMFFEQSRVFVFCAAVFLAQSPVLLSHVVSQTNQLKLLPGCKFIQTTWADGDSFLIEDQTGKRYTIRLYGVDCFEYHVTDDSDARRLCAQRRYFGISKNGASAENSINTAKHWGQQAAEFVRKELQQPFDIYTSFADGGGDGRYKRIYGFVKTAGGQDLGEMLVQQGLARAFGVYRKTPDGRHRDEYRQWLKDTELQAAKRATGVWAITDWESLPDERRLEWEEERETKLATQNKTLETDQIINLNTAARDKLMLLPGIGETLANRIIENRPYKTIESVLEVNGIGPKKLEAMRPNIKL